MNDPRDRAALRRHYDIERELADRLRAAPAADRPALYRDLYNELFRRVPDHPQNVWKESATARAGRVAEQLMLLAPFLTPGTVYLEVGAGDGHLARRIAGRVARVYAADVADVIRGGDEPANFEPLLADATDLPLADGSVDVAYSNMLVEHLHPDDFDLHLREVRRVLAPGGRYVCRTPHRFTGPQDISGLFDDEPTGFHMKEYSFGELAGRFRAAGFGAVGVRVRAKGVRVPVPAAVMRAAEGCLGVLPHRLRRRVCRTAALRPAFQTVTVVARVAPRPAGRVRAEVNTPAYTVPAGRQGGV